MTVLLFDAQVGPVRGLWTMALTDFLSRRIEIWGDDGGPYHDFQWWIQIWDGKEGRIMMIFSGGPDLLRFRPAVLCFWSSLRSLKVHESTF